MCKRYSTRRSCEGEIAEGHEPALYVAHGADAHASAAHGRTAAAAATTDRVS